MTEPNPLDDWRTATRYRWTRPDGTLDIAAMCRAMDADYAARFGTGEPRSVPNDPRNLWDNDGAQEMGVPGAVGAAPALDEDR